MIKSSISKVIKLNISRNFFEMHKLYRIWRHDLHFITCKIVSFLVLLLLHRIGNLLAYISAFLVASFWVF